MFVLGLSLVSPVIVTLIAPCLRPNTTNTGTPVPYNIAKVREARAASQAEGGALNGPKGQTGRKYTVLATSELEAGGVAGGVMGVGGYGAVELDLHLHQPQQDAYASGGAGGAAGGIRRASSGGTLSSSGVV